MLMKKKCPNFQFISLFVRKISIPETDVLKKEKILCIKLGPLENVGVIYSEFAPSNS